ncbi:MAG: Ca-activated chloride channel family protein [Pseudohongiellaceae bacterium]|jgi:Ca-activated chloride channel family protein
MTQNNDKTTGDNADNADNNNNDISPMTDLDDPRLTAWALGELDSPETDGDAAAVARFVDNSPEAQAAVKEIRQLAGMLGDSLASEAGEEDLGLDADRRAALSQALQQGPATDAGTELATHDATSQTRRPTLMTRLRPFMAAAALLLVAVFVADSVWNTGTAQEGAVIVSLSEQESGAIEGAVATLRDRGRNYSVAQNGAVPQNTPADSAALTRSSGDQSELLDALRPLGYAGGRSDLSSSSTITESEKLRVLKQLGYSGEPSSKASQQALSRDDGPQRELEQLGYLGASSGNVPTRTVPTRQADDALAIAPASKPTNAGSSLNGGFPNNSGSAGLLTGRGRKAAGLPPSKAAAAVIEEPNLLSAEVQSQLNALGYLGDRDDNYERKLADRTKKRIAASAGEQYAPIIENPFVPITSEALSALSTFGIDVDTASYANMRRFLHRNELPPANALRIEELINYFTYDDPAPEGSVSEGDVPFATTLEVASCPWESRHRLVRVALKGQTINPEERAATHLIFLLDVSGSMSGADRLPLLIKSLELLLEDMSADDKISIVTYASGTELVLPPTSCAEKQAILNALHSLKSGGSTHASAGIQMAYDVAAQGFIEDGNNRILLATDGDFNMGVTSGEGLHELIRKKAAGGVFLTVLGFGTGNFNDATAELLADKGNGNYSYIDSLTEAHKVLVAERDATLVTIAKDVKIQVEFNPGKVAAYRLIGYENRALAAADFRNDKKDAGEIGAGHSVVALYEVVPRGVEGVIGSVELKYQQQADPQTFVDSPELLTVNLRWKRPDEDVGRELAVPLEDQGGVFAEASEEYRFSAAVAAFGMVLRGSEHSGDATVAWIVETADGARSFDPLGDRSEFVRLARTAQGLLQR